LAVTGDSITMQDVSSTYKDVFGKDIPKTPELLSKLFLRFSTGAKDVYVYRRPSMVDSADNRQGVSG
jgi:hypothetical protein